jgi:RHS Repeat.
MTILIPRLAGNVYVVTLGLMIFSFFDLYGQIPGPPPSLPSPNAASLGLFGEYPVSHFTGVPQISIPVYTLRSGKAEMAVTMDYHASGFRPDMHPGWVGMGWNLSVGGAISRTVKDMPDDYNNGNYYLGANNGFYFNHGVLNPSNWSTTTYMQSIAQSNDMLKDTEPDEFSFHVNGISGTFYMGHDGQWKVRCDRPIKVTFDGIFLDVPFDRPSGSYYEYYGYFPSFSSFTITDENGVQYKFGGTTDAIEYSIDFFNQYDDEWIANTWYLTSVDYGFGDFIGLTYERDAFVNQMTIAVNNNLGTSSVGSGGIFNPVPGCSSWSYASIGASYRGQLVSPVYLTTMSSKHEVIHFDRSTTTELRYAQSVFDWMYSQWYMYPYYASFLPYLEDYDYYDTYPSNLSKLQWKKLDRIRIEVDEQQKRSFNFTYSSSSSQRLTLQSIREHGAEGGLLRPYTFTYNTSVSLPGYLANRTDHWGFYNGTYADISNTSTYHLTYYNYRQPNATYLQAGTLNRITYPTGGVTDFTFEPHYYRMAVPEARWNAPTTLSSNTLAGGLRIRKISSYDPEFPSSKVEKEYFYVKGYTNGANVASLQSSGILGGQSRYYFDDYRVRSFNDVNTYSQSRFSSQSVLPASENSRGSHIGYSEVVEKRSDGSYTISKYSNFDVSIYRDLAPVNDLLQSRTEYSPYRSRAHYRGKLLEETNYSSADLTVMRRTQTYTAVSTGSEVRSMRALYFNVCPGTAVSVREGTAYAYYADAYLPLSETIYEYDEAGANPVTTTKSYTYDANYRLPKQEQTVDSRGQTMRTKYRYVFDVLTNYSSSYNNAQLYPYSYLVYSHNIATPIEVVNTVVEGGTEKITGATVLTHTGTRQYYYPSYQWRSVPQVSYRLGNLLPIAVSGYVPFSVTRSGSSEAETLDIAMVKDAEFEFQPSRTYNKIRYVGYIDAAGKAISTIHGQFMKHPIARITGGRFLESAYSSFETTANDSDWRGGGGQVLTRYNDQDAPVGMYCTNNTGTSGYITTYDKQLVAGNTYVLTFWEKGGTVTIRNSGAVVVSNTILQTKGSWQQREIRVQSVSGNLGIIPAGYIDDVRLYPLGAQMESYTYNQLGAVTTSTDSKGYTTYYEYDQFNRLLRVKDRQGRILQDYTYHLK